MIIVNVIIAITMTMMMTTREDCLSNLGMADPPNPGRGNFYNVYIHHNEVIYLVVWFEQERGPILRAPV